MGRAGIWVPKVKSVLITGAAKRIGRAIALGFAAKGWHIFAHYHGSVDDAQTLADDITAAGGTASLIPADLADAEAAQALIGDCIMERPLDCVINNAAAFSYDFPGALNDDVWQTAIAVNLRAPIIIGEEYYNYAKNNDRPSLIINMLDNKVFALNPDFFSYTIAKAGLHAATQMMATAFAPTMRVCGLAPGITMISGRQTEESFKKAQTINPLGRGCALEDIVSAALFIATAPFASGETLTVDCGQSLLNLPRDVAFLNPAYQRPAP
ncbi:MAG: NAD(P)-dependent dehydrogenase (short-subunit alcohol dehydrogenase family) [Alphaproteobacteria bacterium]|jgi:NAD(P)-dependent dehydrogenase (short-subunit alcohol dehydrogenase family)